MANLISTSSPELSATSISSPITQNNGTNPMIEYAGSVFISKDPVIFLPISLSMNTLSSFKDALPTKAKLLLTTKGVIMTSCDVRDLNALIH